MTGKDVLSRSIAAELAVQVVDIIAFDPPGLASKTIFNRRKSSPRSRH
jgi:hypothetical protein